MFDVTSLVTFLTNDTVMSCILAFVAGLGSVMAYNRITESRTSRAEPPAEKADITPPEPEQRDHHAPDPVIEAVVSEYTRRLQQYDKVIADLRVRLDIMEARESRVQPPRHKFVEEVHQTSHEIITPRDMSQPLQATSRPVEPHTSRVTPAVEVTQRASVIAASDDGVENRNGTTDYILKLLAERPRSSREVQQAIGRSREHTSRLMKRLNDGGLVVRDNTSKPFTYAITALGQSRLREKGAAAPAGQQSPPDRSIPFPGEP